MLSYFHSNCAFLGNQMLIIWKYKTTQKSNDPKSTCSRSSWGQQGWMSWFKRQGEIDFCYERTIDQIKYNFNRCTIACIWQSWRLIFGDLNLFHYTQPFNASVECNWMILLLDSKWLVKTYFFSFGKSMLSSTTIQNCKAFWK